MYEIKDKEFELLIQAIPILMKIKVNGLEKAVEDCKGVGESYREIKKFKKAIDAVYREYKDLMEGLGYLAINRNEFDKRVNELLNKYKDSRFYLEMTNGNGSK